MATFTKSLEQAISQAFKFATEKKHQYVTLEHLLLALTDETDARNVMKACNVDVDLLNENLNILRSSYDVNKLDAALQELFNKGLVSNLDILQTTGDQLLTNVKTREDSLKALEREKKAAELALDLEIQRGIQLDKNKSISFFVMAKEGNKRITFGFASPVKICSSHKSFFLRSLNSAGTSKPIISPLPLTCSMVGIDCNSFCKYSPILTAFTRRFSFSITSKTPSAAAQAK